MLSILFFVKMNNKRVIHIKIIHPFKPRWRLCPKEWYPDHLDLNLSLTPLTVLKKSWRHI